MIEESLEMALMTMSVMALYIIILVLFLKLKGIANLRSKREKKKSLSKFYEALDKMFGSDHVIDKSDIEILKRAIEREADTVYSLAPLLEDYLLYLGERGSQESQSSQRYQVIKEIILSEKEDKPFVDISREERRLLIGMRDAIKHVDTDSMSFNLNELTSVLSTRGRVYKGVLKANRSMRPLAISALAVSIVSVSFGILGVLY